MRHDLIIEGRAFRLRPVEMADAALILGLRRDLVRAHFLHPTSPRLVDQEVWLTAYFDRTGDYYFIVERYEGNTPEGTVGIYDMSADGSTAEWGRWILRPGSLAAVESALLVYRAAFDRLGLEKVYCRTVAQNKKAVSFHDSCGLIRNRRLPAYITLPQGPVDVIEHCLLRADWPNVAVRLDSQSERLARLLARRVKAPLARGTE